MQKMRALCLIKKEKLLLSEEAHKSRQWKHMHHTLTAGAQLKSPKELHMCVDLPKGVYSTIHLRGSFKR